MATPYQECVHVINAHCAQGQWRKALCLALECGLKYNNAIGFSLGHIVRECAFTAAELATASDFVRGLHLFNQRRYQSALTAMCKAWAQRPSPLIMCYIGELCCLEGNLDEGRGLLLNAMTDGCTNALHAFDPYSNKHIPYWTLAVVRSHLVTATAPLGIKIKCEASILTTPFGLWRPTRTYHRIVAPCIHDAMMTFLLVAKRLDVDRNVALIICSFIVTHGPWYRVIT
jgi:hypothetical protein